MHTWRHKLYAKLKDVKYYYKEKKIDNIENECMYVYAYWFVIGDTEL